MKYVYWIAGSLLGVVVLFVALQLLASERVEVVELHAVQPDGEVATTRLWIVDDAGYPYLRSANGGSSWMQYVSAGETFTLTRQGATARYTAVPRPDKREIINERMQAKYTWGNSFILLFTGGGLNALPMELHAAPAN